jgi:hypothetical protein
MKREYCLPIFCVSSQITDSYWIMRCRALCKIKDRQLARSNWTWDGTSFVDADIE